MTAIWSNGTEGYRYATANDLGDISKMLEDSEVGRFLWFTPIHAEGVEAYFRPLLEAQQQVVDAGENPTSAVFTVVDSEGRFMGQGAVIEVVGSPGGFELGYQLTRAAVGCGVGTRLSLFLTAYAVYVLDAYRLEGSCMEQNTASRRLFEKLGLGLEGTRRGYRLKGDVRHNELLFGSQVARLDMKPVRDFAQHVGLVRAQ